MQLQLFQSNFFLIFSSLGCIYFNIKPIWERTREKKTFLTSTTSALTFIVIDSSSILLIVCLPYCQASLYIHSPQDTSYLVIITVCLQPRSRFPFNGLSTSVHQMSLDFFPPFHVTWRPHLSTHLFPHQSSALQLTGRPCPPLHLHLISSSAQQIFNQHHSQLSLSISSL